MLTTLYRDRRMQCLIAVLLFAVFILAIVPWKSAYELDTDEGINLGKAALVARGFHPYRDIWNDQPPVFTYVLASLELAAPHDPACARLLVLAFACLLVGVLFHLVQRNEGPFAALVAILLLASGFRFQVMTATVLVGLPALSLAMLALVICMIASRIWRVILAGALFGLALQTKFFVMTMAPAFVAALFLSPGFVSMRQRIGSAGIWAGASLAIFTFITWVAGEPFLQQIIAPHYRAAMNQFRPFGSLVELASFLGAWSVLVPCGLVGAAVSIWKPSRDRTVALIWFGCSFVVLANHSPLFYHQVILIAVPLAWLSGVALSEFGNVVEAWRMSWVSGFRRLSLLVLAVAAIPYWKESRAAFFRSAPQERNWATLTALASAPSRNEWLITDRPMDAYRAGLFVPPSLVVFSSKRLQTSNLPPSLIMREVEQYMPTHVMFRRFSVDAEVRGYLLRKGYVSELESARMNFFRFRAQ